MSQELRPFHEVVVEKIAELVSARKPDVFTLDVLCELIADSVIPNPTEMAEHLERFRGRFAELGSSSHLNLAVNSLRRRTSAEAATNVSRSNTAAELCGND